MPSSAAASTSSSGWLAPSRNEPFDLTQSGTKSESAASSVDVAMQEPAAPHPIAAKEAASCCAGIYTAPTAVELYAQVFDEEGALEHLAAFASENGPRFYGLPVNEGRLRLDRAPTEAPGLRESADGAQVLPFHPKAGLHWTATRA